MLFTPIMFPIILEVEISFNIDSGAVLGFGGRQHGRQRATELHLCVFPKSLTHFVKTLIHLSYSCRRSFNATSLTSNFKLNMHV